MEPGLLITTIGGGMRVAAYLPTRTFERAVHILDIAAATGLDVDLPATVLAGSSRWTSPWRSGTANPCWLH